MKKLKKFAAVCLSIMTCVISSTSLTAKADVVYFKDEIAFSERYEISEPLSEYTGVTVYQSKKANDYNKYSYFYSRSYSNSYGEGKLYSTFEINFSIYENLTSEEIISLSEYLSVAYPNISLETIYTDSMVENGVEIPLSTQELIYNEEVSYEEQLQIAVDIKNNTNLTCQYSLYEDLLTGIKSCGDVDENGSIDALDASEILTYYAAVQTGKSDDYTDEEKDIFALVGDYDGDGTVNAMDASDVLTVYAEAQTS